MVTRQLPKLKIAGSIPVIRSSLFFHTIRHGGQMREVNVGHKYLADYQSIVPKGLMAEIAELAEPLKGKRVLHVNATSFGGGVAEILYTLVPLMKDVGLEAEWHVMTAPAEFFTVTKGFHNGLQGHAFDAYGRGAPALRGRLSQQRCRPFASLRRGNDPRPAAAGHALLRRRRRAGGARWVWRCHIDTSTPDAGLYDVSAAVHRRLRCRHLHHARLRAGRLGVPVTEIAPCIDPLAPKNMALPPEEPPT